MASNPAPDKACGLSVHLMFMLSLTMRAKWRDGVLLADASLAVLEKSR
jgi:hypothetical protein